MKGRHCPRGMKFCYLIWLIYECGGCSSPPLKVSLPYGMDTHF
nr:MAG TPA: Protein of unknown function (DUF1062) [Caudoviricetes sp.]